MEGTVLAQGVGEQKEQNPVLSVSMQKHGRQVIITSPFKNDEMITEGQTIYLKPISMRRGDDTSLRAVTVKRVSRKYFTVDPDFGRFDITTLKHDGGQYSSRYHIYLSEEDYNLKVERDSLISKLQKCFGGGHLGVPYTLEQLRAVDKIINP